MANRFGRNQKRQMAAQVARAQAAALHAQDIAWKAQSEMRNLRARAVIVDVEAIENHRQRAIELRASIHAAGRESLHYGIRHDPEQSAFARDTADLHRAIANQVAGALVDAVERGRFPQRP